MAVDAKKIGAQINTLRKKVDRLEDALEELRDYAAKEITREGAHQDPIWSKVADLLD